MENSKLFVVFTAICVVLGAAGTVSAHQTWIEIDAMCVDLDDTVDVRLTEGHNFIGEGPPPFDVSAELVDPAGARTPLMKTGENDLYWHSSFDADLIGLYSILGLHVDENMWKVYTGPGSRPDRPDSLYTYLPGDVNWSEIDKSNWTDDWHVVLHYTPYKYSKAFVSANCNFHGTDRATEQPLELIPLDDVATVGTGDFEFKVLWNGEPLPDGTIQITGTRDRETKVSAICDYEGKATLPLNISCDWLITASAVNDTAHWDGEYDDTLPHGENYTGPGGFVGDTHSAALTLMQIREGDTVTMRAEIRPGIQFSVTPAYIDFGELDPGDTSDPETIVIQNMGSKDLKSTVEVTDMNGLYTGGLHIDASLWSEFETAVLKDEYVSLDTKLCVPEDFTGSGEMKGTMIFWAEAV
ncbi:MAG TPA: DUF4198 domain-containing protein [Methanosarcinales archaeon]|nr:DUF4198 domain-containing protein [Methanosarcinales archaeon]